MVPVHRKKPQYTEVAEKNSYSLYKEDLNSDFNKSCGYCDCPDFVWGGKAGFQIDHFAPQNKFPDLHNSYQNLVYSCPICNRGKSNKWPSNSADTSVQNNEGFIHPCSAEYNDHLERSPRGEIVSKTELGRYMSTTMKLGLTRHQIIWIREELFAVMREVEEHMSLSSALRQKHSELAVAYCKYDEVLRGMIDKR